MTTETLVRARPGGKRRSSPDGQPLTLSTGLGLGVAMLWFSLLVLIPLAAVVVTASGAGWSGFWQAVTNAQTASAIRLTVGTAFLVTIVNVVMGTTIAWVLVRDRFFGQRVIEFFIDIPFALPTIVAGLVLLSLYGPRSPIGVNIANAKPAVFVAFLFVTLPFVVRAVQPVLLEMETDVEEAAASLGAGGFAIARRIIFPTILPAILAGSTLGFARCVGEYGAVVLISGNIPLKTEVASVAIFGRIENADINGAVALAVLLLIILLAVLLAVSMVSQLQARRTSSAG